MLDTAQFNAYAAKYMDTVFRLAFSMLKSPADADDVTQNVLLRLYRTDYPFESDDHVRSWLMKVTVNECRKVWRRPFRSHENIDDYAETLAFEDPSYRDLFEAIMQLDRDKRTVIVLYYIEGYSIKEAADMLGISEAACKKRLERARKKLKEIL